MNYDDLRFAIKRREQLKQQAHTGDIELAYNKYSIYTYLEVSVPETWNKMDEEFVRVKYPNHSNPIEIFTAPDYASDFIIQIDPSIPLLQQEIKGFKKSIKDKIMRLQPANVFYGDGEDETEKLKICWFDFGSYGLEGMVYNLVFFTSANGYLCTGSFHCQEPKALDWKPIFLDVLRTLNRLNVESQKE